jgi:hypothetical protein
MRGYGRRSKSSVSLAMIVRDEASALPRCLNSAIGLFDEIVVVDTGSVDRTREIARSFGATVVDFAWCDDFSAARNMAMSRCTCDYIFWLDADEMLPRVSAARLRRLLNRGLEQHTVYIVYQKSNRPDGSFGFVESLSPRLFPNHSGLRWSRRVYEEILPTVRANGLTPRFIDIRVNHLGFARPATLLRKLLRNHHLLEIDLAKGTDDPVTLLNAAMNHALIGRCASQVNGLNMCRQRIEGMLEKHAGAIDPPLEAAACALLARTRRDLGSVTLALEICRQSRSCHATDVGLMDCEAFLLRDLGMWEKAEALYDALPSLQEYSHMRSLGDARYLRLVSAKIRAAYHYEEVSKHCHAFLIWAELTKNSAGVFDAPAGVRRTARRVLREALVNTRAFLDELRCLRRRGLSGPSATMDIAEFAGSRSGANRV